MAGQAWIERGKRRLMRVWDEPGLVTALDARLREKDGKELKDGKFARYVVALHTDEDMLDHDEAERWLRGHSFIGLRQVTDAYLLFSYIPAINGYPFIRLTVGQ
jgi:hypothetical protein